MHLPLRVKLILVMSVVVAGAAVGTAWVAQGVVSKAYEAKFEGDFKAAARYFAERQLNRLNDMRKRCTKLAAQDETIAALKKGDSSEIHDLVMHELKEFYAASQGAPPPSGDRNGPPQLGRGPFPQGKGGKGPVPQATNAKAGEGAKLLRSLVATASDRPTVAVLNADGNVIAMIDTEGKLVSKGEARGLFGKRPGDKPPRGSDEDKARESKNEQMKERLKSMSQRAGDEQEIAYTTMRGMDDKDHLREVIVTPVLDPQTRQPVGALIVSALMTDLGERALQSFSRETDTAAKSDVHESISSGFWLDGVLHTETIPESARETVSNLVATHVDEVKDSSDFQGGKLALAIDGESVPHRVIFRVLNPGSPFPPACQVALYSLRDELAEERNLQKKILTVGLISLAVALVLILIISRNFVQPIRALVAGTAQIRAGNFDVKVDAKRRDELGQLAASFNDMAEGLRMNQKYQRLLSQVADRLVAEQLVNNEAALGGELREVSVLFCDIRGFTKFTSGMPPHEVIAMLNEHMSALTALVHDHYGVVDKFVGDMVMALFGAPSAYGDDACRAAQCALRMVQVRDELNASGRWKVQVGIGIATGTVVAGCMGSEERLDYTVLGERVNLASRLCGRAAPGEVLIDQTTLDKLGAGADYEALPNLELKGFDPSVMAFRLWGWEARPLGTRSTPLVGTSPTTRMITDGLQTA